MPQANKKTGNNSLTVKEAASKLDISESTVKKYVKDFDLETEKGPQNKPILSESTFQALTEIVKLRANGLSIQEIKELKSQEPSKNVLDEIEETASIKPKEEISPQNGSIESTVTASEIPQADSGLIDASALKEEISQAEEGVVVTETETEKENEEEIISEEVEVEEGGRRRRTFNYRYVERQISTDSKRVSSLRLRLRNPNISVQDRLFFEEALERRILFLNGWKHILRWISTK